MISALIAGTCVVSRAVGIRRLADRRGAQQRRVRRAGAAAGDAGLAVCELDDRALRAPRSRPCSSSAPGRAVPASPSRIDRRSRCISWCEAADAFVQGGDADRAADRGAHSCSSTSARSARSSPTSKSSAGSLRSKGRRIGRPGARTRSHRARRPQALLRPRGWVPPHCDPRACQAMEDVRGQERALWSEPNTRRRARHQRYAPPRRSARRRTLSIGATLVTAGGPPAGCVRTEPEICVLLVSAWISTDNLAASAASGRAARGPR